MVSFAPLAQFRGVFRDRAGWRPTLAVFLLIACGSAAPAATLTWDITPGVVGPGNGTITGGTGTWNTTNGNWTADGGANNVAWPGSGTNNDAVFGGTAGTVSIAAGGVAANEVTINSNYTIQSNSLTLNGSTPTITTDTGVNASISSVIAGTGGWTKAGAGTLTLSNASNSFSGGLTISGGTLSTSSTGNLPSGNAITLSNGATWRSTVTVPVGYSNNLIVAAGDSGVFLNNSGNVRLIGSFSGIAGSVTFDDSGSAGAQGLILDGGAYGKAQTGSVITYKNTSATSVNPRLGSTSAMEAFENSKMAFIRTGAGLLDLRLSLSTGSDFRVGALDGGDAGTRIFYESAAHGGTTVTITGVTNGDFAGVLSSAGNGIGALIKNGGGTQTLSGANTYAGTTTINNGVLQIGNGGASGTLGGGAVTINSPGNLTFNRNDSITVGNLIGGNGGLTQAGSGTLTLSNAGNNYSGATTVSGGILFSSNAGFVPAASGVTIANGAIWRLGTTAAVYTNALTIANGQSGVVQLNSGTGNQQFNGNVAGVAGNLTFDTSLAGSSLGTILAGSSMGVAANGSVVTFSKGSNGNTTVDRLATTSAMAAFANSKVVLSRTGGGAQQLLLGLNSAGTAQFGALDGGDSSTTLRGDLNNFAVSLTINGTTNGDFAGNITSVNNFQNVTKTGSGTQIFSGANSYTGTTTINGGVLRVNGTHTSAGAYNVNSGGTLGGAGAITTAGANITLAAGGKLSPGASIGTLTMSLGAGTLDLSAIIAGALVFELGPGLTSDQVVLNSGTLNIGTLNFNEFNFIPLAGTALGTYKLFDSVNPVVGSLGTTSGFFAGGTRGGYIWLDNGNRDVMLTLDFIAVPEPHTLLLAALGLVGLAGLARRRRI